MPFAQKLMSAPRCIQEERMQVSYAYFTTTGSVREHNEDSCAYWEDAGESDSSLRGAVAIVADGVGGQGFGEVASKLAAEESLKVFCDSSPAATPPQLIKHMFDAANLAVYNMGMDFHYRQSRQGRMATTLTVTIFRHNGITVGHVGDCRVYVVDQRRMRRVTSDHSFVGVQLKLGLLTVEEAQQSEMRSVLTRTVGQDPFIRADCFQLKVSSGDRVVQCCDGIHAFVSENDIERIVREYPPNEACRELALLADRNGSDDNLTVQIVHVREVDEVMYWHGLPVIFQKPARSEMAREITVGDVLDGRFSLNEEIARSGMATIFKGIDHKTERTVAVKVPHLQFESDPGFYTRFQREEEIGARLNHPYIMRVEAVPEKGRPYLVMEYLEGQTLGNFMRAVRPLPVDDAMKIASRISEALIYLHEHDVVHRDLKPDNVMICNDGSIRIMDFGIAKSGVGRRLTFSGFQPAMGTPDYMAPEQVKGKRGDARTDIYSLGAILYEMLTGHSPFEGDNPLVVMNARLTGDPVAPRKLNPKISPQIEEIVLEAMAREPSARYATAREFKTDLDHPSEVRVTGRVERLRPPSMFVAKTRSVRLIVVAVLIPLAVLLGFLIKTYFDSGPSSTSASHPTTWKSRGGVKTAR
jgi:serine/threonine-protein kinase